ncbi:MAG: hypothetical protein LUC37_05730 [Prevotella sp.]|nr:hypothetical protein [Prevotella sp.]
MIGKDGNRMLAYTEAVTNITPIEKADRLEAVHINGWVCVCGKGEFQIGDIGVFFEIDSKLPEVPPFTEMPFVVSKQYRIKSQKIRGQYSQGLFLPLSAFDTIDPTPAWVTDLQNRIRLGENVLHEDLTQTLGVTYAVPADNIRKAPTPDKYSLVSTKHPHIILNLLAPKKKRNRTAFPSKPFISKSDEERCENLPPSFLEDKTPYRKTLKIDGTSTLFLLERKHWHRFEFWVCSRNVRVLNDQSKTYQDSNVYWEMAKKYDIENKLRKMLDAHPEWDYVAVQGETAGVGCQGNPHKLPDTRFYVFNFIDSIHGRWDSVKARDFLKNYDILFVPIVEENYILPDDFEEFKLSADGPIELADASGLREGYVYRSSADPYKSFKNVSRKYLLKHNE